MRARNIRVFMAGAAASCAMICTTPAPAADMSPALAKLVADANAEKTLDVSWGPSSGTDAQDLAEFNAAMAREWGSKITINFTPGPSMPQVGRQIAGEFANGQKAMSDIYYSSGPFIAPLLSRNIFLAPDWGALLPGRITDKAAEAHNQIVRAYTGLTGATYNTQLAPARPERLTDFLKPEWKGKFATTPYGAGFDVISANGVWGPEKTLDFVKQLSKQVAGLIRCSEIERVASGEYLALTMDCNGQSAAVWKSRGAPIDQSVLLDAAQLRYFYMSVPKNAAHPAAATLFIAFLQSVAGQELMWKFWHDDLHWYPQSHLRAQVEDVEKRGGKFTDATTDWILSHPEIDKTIDEAVKVLMTNP